ncbi:MAG TPA: hypothetical protein VFA89_02485 [Terriglobales bacterium]|nr:hypothetical protein [Terriglobales bacterium]
MAQIGWIELLSSREREVGATSRGHEAFLAEGINHHWDSNSMLNMTGSPPIPIGDEIYLYFTSRAGFLGMARLTLDRLAGMRAGDGEPALEQRSYDSPTGPSVEPVWDGRHVPYVVSKTVRVTGPKLELNLQTSPGGALRVSIHRPYKDKSDAGGR